MLKSARGDQRRARALAFEDHVRGHRGAMQHLPQIGWLQSGLRQNRIDPGHEGLRRIDRD